MQSYQGKNSYSSQAQFIVNIKKTCKYQNTSTEPTCWENPFAIAGFIVYFAIYRLIRRLSLSDLPPSIDPLTNFILWAVCHVLIITWERSIYMKWHPSAYRHTLSTYSCLISLAMNTVSSKTHCYIYLTFLIYCLFLLYHNFHSKKFN